MRYFCVLKPAVAPYVCYCLSEVAISINLNITVAKLKHVGCRENNVSHTQVCCHEMTFFPWCLVDLCPKDRREKCRYFW